MDKERKIKKCELCNCETKKPFLANYFDFCIDCIIGEGWCKKCQIKLDLNHLTKIRLKTEMVIMSTDWNLEDAELLREMLKGFEKEQKR